MTTCSSKDLSVNDILVEFQFPFFLPCRKTFLPPQLFSCTPYSLTLSFYDVTLFVGITYRKQNTDRIIAHPRTQFSRPATRANWLLDCPFNFFEKRPPAVCMYFLLEVLNQSGLTASKFVARSAALYPHTVQILNRNTYRFQITQLH